MLLVAQSYFWRRCYRVRAPIAILSSKKRAALVACLSGGGTLRKHDGVWIAASARPGDKPIAGVTVADLGREGMLTLTVLRESASAQLTTRGSWVCPHGGESEHGE